MRIAVTGASGFVGRHVLQELLRHEVKIVAAIRDATHAIGLHKSIEVAILDLAQPPDDPFTLLGKPDVLIHLAWNGLPNYTSLHHFATELPRQYRFLKGMVEAGLSSVVATGTCLEYGMQYGCLSETTPTQPENAYGHAKDALRRQLEFLRSKRPYSLTWARLFYMHGKGQPASSLYPRLLEAVDRGDDSFPMSGGEQLRDYLPVEQVAQKVVRLALIRRNIGVVNICSGKPISVRNLVDGWLQVNGWSIKLQLGAIPYPAYEPMAFWGDASRLQSIEAEK